jgi:shikimate dehydrogenase
MKKKVFKIIGNPISHSLSPALHSYWFAKYKIAADYKQHEIKESEIEVTLNDVRDGKIDGLNVTLPFKQKVIPYLDILINDAKSTSSVNTIFMSKEGKLTGDNTDVYGMQAAYLKDITLNSNRSTKAIVIGAGGVAPSIIFALKKTDIKKVFIANRTREKAIFMKKKFPFIDILNLNEVPQRISEFDIIINATSLGLKNGEQFNINLDGLTDKSIFIDTIYNPLETKIIKHLKGKNIKTFNGLDMLIYQGQKSFYIWNKINPEIDDELIQLLENRIKC